MEKASPVDLRKCIEMANALVSAGVRFVPMPVIDDLDMAVKMKEAMDTLSKIEMECE